MIERTFFFNDSHSTKASSPTGQDRAESALSYPHSLLVALCVNKVTDVVDLAPLTPSC